jgi:hypothetical protein
MSKVRDISNLSNVIRTDASGNVSFVSGSTTLATLNTSGQLSGSSPVLSSSYASTSSYATNFNVSGTITATTLVVQTVTSSVIYSSGSNVFGNNIANTQVFTGSVYINPGGLFVSSSGIVGIGTTSPKAPLHIYSSNQNVASDLATSYTNAKFRLEPYYTSGVGISMGLISPNTTYLQSAYNDGLTPAPFSIQPYSGSVGIGNITPLASLDIYLPSIGAYFRGGSDNVGRQLKISSATTTNAGDTHIIDAQSGTGVLQISTTSTPRVYIPANGSSATLGGGGILKIIGSGTNSGYTELQFYTYNGPTNQPPVSIGIIKTDNGGYENGEFFIATKATNANTAPVERLRISSTGNLNFNTAGSGAAYIQINQVIGQDGGILWLRNNTTKFQQAVDGSDNMVFYSYTISANSYKINGNGSASLYGALTQNASDRRLKNNITNIPNALDKIKTLNGVTFNWENNIFKTERTNDIGVIAQEVQSVLPEAVALAPFDIDSEGNSKSGENYLTVYYEKLIPLLIEGIKELKAENDTLKEILQRNNIQ